MVTAAENLERLINDELSTLDNAFEGNSFYAIVSLIRAIDTLHGYNTPSTLELGKNYGWNLMMKSFYSKLDLNSEFPFFDTDIETDQWITNTLHICGKIGYCLQLLDCNRALLIEIFSESKNEFSYKYTNQLTDVEFFDRQDFEELRKLITEKIVSERKKDDKISESEVINEFSKLITNPFGKYISYDTNPKIDEFFRKKGHYHLLGLQGYDDFNEDDKFGGIPYSKYLDLIEESMGIAFKHLKACDLLVTKNPAVNIYNILSYISFKEKMYKDFAHQLDLSIAEIEQLFSCITLNKDNYNYYLNLAAIPPTPYIELSRTRLIRSINGCLNRPFRILHYEFKRKFSNDYFEAVNRRESRFRNELYLYFTSDRFIKIPQSIVVQNGNIKTDIDAILFDKEKKALGLFQLKWQDVYAYSIKERFSRITNLYPKSIEWLDKVIGWVETHESKEILEKLQIQRYFSDAEEIHEIYFFIIGRNQIHFSGTNLDSRAAWGSWSQFILSTNKIFANFDNPIKELYVKLKVSEPKYRISREPIPQQESFELLFESFKVYKK